MLSMGPSHQSFSRQQEESVLRQIRHHKRIAELMALKKKGEYAQIISYIRTRVRFNLLRSILVAVRGVRGKRTKAGPISSIEYGLIPIPKD